MNYKSLASGFAAFLDECQIRDVVLKTGIPLSAFKQIFYAGAGTAVEVLDASGREALVNELFQSLSEDTGMVFKQGERVS
jgi:hypothetical protein